DTPGSPNTDPKGHKTGWGLDLSSTLKPTKSDKVLGSVVFGDGIANYMNDGGMDIAPDTVTGSTATAKAVPLVGFMLYLDHFWSEKFSTTLGYAQTQVSNTNLQTPSAYHMGQYASINLVYYPVKDVFYGIEYLWGRREDKDGNSGEDNRVQVSAHYNFS